jgi:hypothetical protein
MWPQFAAFKLKCNLNIRSTATSGFYYQKLQSGATMLNPHFKKPLLFGSVSPPLWYFVLHAYFNVLNVWNDRMTHPYLDDNGRIIVLFPR